jgi:predicted transcriptional regulator
MSSRRSRLQISIEILNAISGGEQKPTRLMYACNLSWNSTKKTLDRLAASGFVDEIYESKKRRRYCITVKGRDVVRYYAGLDDLMQISV